MNDKVNIYIFHTRYLHNAITRSMPLELFITRCYLKTDLCKCITIVVIATWPGLLDLPLGKPTQPG